MVDRFEAKKLGELTTKLGSGITPRGGKKVYKSSGIPFIRSQNVYNDYFTYEGITYLPKDKLNGLENVAIQKNDNLINITGDSVARSTIVPDDLVNGRVNQHVMIIRPDEKLINYRYLHYYLISPITQKTLLSLADSGGTRKALTKEMMSELEIPLPPLPTQERIADILGTLDDKIELNRQMNHTLEAMARTIFKSWFVDFDPVYAKMEGRDYPLPAEVLDLFPDELVESELGLIPLGWRVGKLKEIIDFNPSYKLLKGTEATYLEMKSLPENGFFPINWRKRGFNSGTKFSNGDTLLARITPCLENGKTAFVNFLNSSEIAWGSTEYIIMRTKGDIPHFYSYLLARDELFRNFAIQSMTGSSGRQRVQRDTLEELPSVIASTKIYSIFGEIIFPMVEKMTINHLENTTLAEMRDTLLPKLLSGEIKVI